MPWSAAGTYTAPAAATGAFAGKVLASSDWNAIFTDLVTGLNYRNGVYSIFLGTVNMNSVADTAVPITLPAGFTRYRVRTIMVWNASVDLTAATQVQVGLFTAAAGGGTAVLAATNVTVSATAESTNNNAQFITPTLANATFTNASLFFRNTTAHGTAATAKVAIEIVPVI